MKYQKPLFLKELACIQIDDDAFFFPGRLIEYRDTPKLNIGEAKKLRHWLDRFIENSKKKKRPGDGE